jgi:ubiquinone/menaquinone biosynthesis C-methylase UbiE
MASMPVERDAAAPDAIAAPDADAKVAFALALKQHWARELYPALAIQARAAAPSSDATDIRAAVHAAPVYPWFAWLERAAQKLMWRAVADSVHARGAADDNGSAIENGGGLALDPALELPAWYTDVDIHIQPGGIWRTDHAAAVYELGAKVVMFGENDDYAFHRLFTDTALPDRDYQRIVDLGCGFGKSTRPFKQKWPDAEVIGIDLSAPVLRLAHRHAADSGLDIKFRQADAQHTGLPDNSADLVTATMVVHELPPPVLGSVLTEAARVLAPGGLLRVLDFQPTGDPVLDLAITEHGARNNEPFLPMLFETDVLAECAAAGLTDARWVAFDERGAGRLPSADWPARTEWHFPWAVLEARKPEGDDE